MLAPVFFLAAGLLVLAGAAKILRPDPTAQALLVETTNDMRINREEIFGPIASVVRADDPEHALALANDR